MVWVVEKPGVDATGNYRDADGRRVRLNDRERALLLEVVDEDTRKVLAFGLVAHSGLRSQELIERGGEKLFKGTGKKGVRRKRRDSTSNQRAIGEFPESMV